MAKSSSIGKSFVWILMGLLILGLGGFGAANLSGTVRTVGTVGDKYVSVDQYARRLQQQIQAVSQQTGESLPFARAQEIGLDRAVLQQLVRERALDHEADEMGLSVGDASLRERILAIAAFQGLNGDFDRESYRLALSSSGLSEAEFETSLREEAARTLLEGAVASGIQMPAIFGATLVDYVGEKRDFTWSRLGEDDLETPVGAPTDAQLAAYFEENAADFVLPESKDITYVVLSPDALLDQVEINENELKEAYNARADEYVQPERRLVERLVFANQETADQAAAALEVNGTSFEQLVEDRGLSLQDVDMGDVGRLELDAAGETVFAAQTGDVVGPLPSPFGPALFRVNGVLPAQNISFEQAREELHGIAAIDSAGRLVEAMAEEFDDQLAGGAALEQMAEETAMQLGQINWTPESHEDVAAYAAFREAAAQVSLDDFPQILPLEDGGVFALRLNEQLPERPAQLDEVRDAVIAAWRSDQIAAQLNARAEPLVDQLAQGGSFADVELDSTIEVDHTRNAYIDRTPDAFMETVFSMAPGEARLLSGENAVFIVKLDAVTKGSEDPQSTALLAQLDQQMNAALAQDVYNIYADDVLRRAGPQINQQSLDAVHVNFP
ncbi:MAG: peptidyl-prolyl cis-trans isomerase [Sulfitobacter sp.]